MSDVTPPPVHAPVHAHALPRTAAERRHEFLYHVLPAWLSAIGAIGALVLTAYTLLVVHETSGQVHDIMNHMGIAPAGK
jgi:hypothetical protein